MRSIKVPLNVEAMLTIEPTEHLSVNGEQCVSLEEFRRVSKAFRIMAKRYFWQIKDIQSAMNGINLKVGLNEKNFETVFQDVKNEAGL